MFSHQVNFATNFSSQLPSLKNKKLFCSIHYGSPCICSFFFIFICSEAYKSFSPFICAWNISLIIAVTNYTTSMANICFLFFPISMLEICRIRFSPNILFSNNPLGAQVKHFHTFLKSCFIFLQIFKEYFEQTKFQTCCCCNS